MIRSASASLLSSDPAGAAGARRQARRRFATALGMALGIFLLFLVLLGAAFFAYLNSSHWVEHTNRVRVALERTVAAMTAAESGQRGFLLTRDRQLLAPFVQAQARARAEVDAVERLTADNPVQRQRLPELRQLVEAKLAELDRTIRLADELGPEAALAVVREGGGDRAMGRIRDLIGSMQGEEARLLADRASRVITVKLLLGILTVAFAVGMVLVLRQSFHGAERDYRAERAEGEALARALAEREELLRKQDLLFREVNHRVKNSLQLICGLLGLQAAAAGDDRTRRQLEEAQGRVLAIGQVHDRLYRRGDITTEVEVTDFLGRLCADLEASAARGMSCTVRFQADPLMLSLDRAVPIGLLINELVTNALKYGIPCDGTAPEVGVTVTRQVGGIVRIRVEDNGPGLPAGFDIEAQTGLGMTLIRSLTQQIDGKLDVEAGRRGGRFTIILTP